MSGQDHTQKTKDDPQHHQSHHEAPQEELLLPQAEMDTISGIKAFDPRSLTPRMVMQLQRTAGNQAVMRMLDSAAKQKAATPNKAIQITQDATSAQETLQRLIGFEIETGIPAKNKMDTGEYEDPDYEDFNIDLPDGSKLDIDSDPAGGGKILEFASAPVDDTQSSEDFKKIAGTWLALLTNLRTKAASSPPIRHLSSVISTAPGYARYGVNKGKPGSMERASIQATHGLRLDQVRSFFKKLALANPTGASRVGAKEQATKESVGSVDPIMVQLKTLHDPATMVGVADNHVEEVAGFFTLMANYMLSGKAVASGYAKNRSFLFYKSKLSDVRNMLVDKNPYAAEVLTDDEAVNRAALILLIVTKRKADEPLWVGTDEPNIWDWMFANLSGDDDPAFEAAKNPWGTDIKPGKVDGGLAAVVEHRDIDKVVPPGGILKLTEPQAIIDYLTAVFEANKGWENIKDDED